MTLSQITTPTLLLDADRCRANIRRITQKLKSQNIQFRPHFKTHQSHEIGLRFRELGVTKITVSSIGMANYFASAGWKDITIAFPVNLRQVEDLRQLARKVQFGLLVLDHETVDILGKQLRYPFTLWIKIDVGTNRTGLQPGDHAAIDQMVNRLAGYSQIQFGGFLAHAGHSYHARSITEVQRVYDQSLATLLDLKNRYISRFPHIQVSLGDTPGVSMVEQFGPVDELRPGNFVFYDLMQEEIGACSLDDIAVAMACPIVAVHPERKQWIIYGGGIHFSKDFLLLPDGRKCFGRMVDMTSTGWATTNTPQNPFIVSLSQEHGIIQCDDSNFNLCRPGDLSLWLPVHSCLTADAMGEYLTLQGTKVDHYRQHLF